MRKYLVVGYVPYDKKEAFVNELNALVIFEPTIYNTDNAEVVVECVKMVDEVIFAEACESDRTKFEIACVMLGKQRSNYVAKVDVETDERVDVVGEERAEE